jgi:XTP/dITP diphosphohydrolase
LRVLLASRNAGKLRELRELLPDWSIEPVDVSAIGEEVGATFRENARGKAEYARSVAPADAWVLGEDSGLEVDALDGRPGLHSARFAGREATDEENVEKLLGELVGVEAADRRARYVCELVLVEPDGTELAARGTLEGSIAAAPRGSGGFGYDPVFVPDGESATVGELGGAWKADRSHRARAARALAASVAERCA